MVFCLITIPLAAVFGTSLPDIIKTLGWGRSPGSVREQAGEAPLFVASVPEAATRPDYPDGGFEDLNARGMGSSPQSPPKISFPDDMRAVQASFSEPAAAGSSNEQTAAVAASHGPHERPVVPVSGNTSGGRFEQIQSRLQDLGAVYFCLESFGAATRAYRFQCAMPLGGDGAVRHFEATAADALEAMERVLADIDNWMKRK